MDFSICDNMVGFPKYSHIYRPTPLCIMQMDVLALHNFVIATLCIMQMDVLALHNFVIAIRLGNISIIIITLQYLRYVISSSHFVTTECHHMPQCGITLLSTIDVELTNPYRQTKVDKNYR